MREEDFSAPQRVVGLAMYLLREIREQRIALDDIEEMSDELKGQGYTDSEINAAFDWVYDRVDGVDPSEIVYRSGFTTHSFRVLHPAERAVLSPEAYGQLIEMQALGMLDMEDMERLIDRALAIGGPMSSQDLRTLVHSYLFEEGTRAGGKGALALTRPGSNTVH
ncbi:DUF494 domain-containing protein [bacterium]|nr:DUF494 domain-containing protein [bacterium]